MANTCKCTDVKKQIFFILWRCWYIWNRACLIMCIVTVNNVLHGEAKNIHKIIMLDCWIKNVAAVTSALVIAFIDNSFKPMYICGENVILVKDVNDAVTVIMALFCLYYLCNIKYPKIVSHFFIFSKLFIKLTLWKETSTEAN